jgi:NTE family protein
MPDAVQEKLINWGYAICDAALRAHCRDDFKRLFDVDVRDPQGLPYASARL